MTIAPGQRKNRIPALAFGLVLLAVAGVALWWYGPWNVERRYQRMDLVSLKQRVDTNPKDFAAWREIGLRLARHGDRMAELPLTQAYTLNNSDPHVATALGEVLLAENHYSEAFQILKSVVERNPKFALARMALGKLYRRKGSYLHASEQYEAVVANNKNYTEAWYELGVCYLLMQQAAKAQSAIDEALRQSPNDPHFLALKGSVDAAVGNVVAGLETTKRAAELAPDNLRIQVNFANMLLAHHRSDEDLKLAEQVIGRIEQLDVRYPLLPYQRGELERLRGNWQAAARFLEQAVRSAPMQDEVYFALSQTYRRLNRKKEADELLTVYRRRQDINRQIDEVRIALGARTEDASLYTKLADLQLQLNDSEGAMNSLQTALQINPKDTKIQNRLQQLKSRSTPQRTP